ncbi:MAG: RHS repeat-associated core domain-containing protein [Kiritimatiellia bacterium]
MKIKSMLFVLAVVSITSLGHSRCLLERGDLFDRFHFRHATKYYDPETGLYYYGERYYSPELGRWINRDPIEEQDGPGLYLFLKNDAINKWDFLGLIEWERLVQIAPREFHTFGCPEWQEFSGQGDGASYYHHFIKYTLGLWAKPKLAEIPLELPDDIRKAFAAQIVAGLGMNVSENKTIWAVTIEPTWLAYSKKYKKEGRCVRDVTVRVLAALIEKTIKDSNRIEVVFKGPPSKDIRTDIRSVNVK